MIRTCEFGRRHADHLLCVDEVLARYGWGINTLGRKWRAEVPEFPSPMNPEQARGFLWHRDVLDDYEHGRWQPLPSGLRRVS